MKKFLFSIFAVGLLLPVFAMAQGVNLEKMSAEEREKRLYEIAIAAMKEYAPSYYTEDIKPVLGYQGPNQDSKHKDYGKMVYGVEFPFDLRKAIGEDREGENVYGGSVCILGENGRAISIVPTGWVREFHIDEADEIRAKTGKHEVAEPHTVPRNPFPRW